MATKRLIQKTDTFIAVKNELYPIANAFFSNENLIDKDFVAKRIEEELRKVQSRAKARLVSSEQAFEIFENLYKEKPSIGGFYLTGGSVPYSYKYPADTTNLRVVWCGGEITIAAFRMQIISKQKVKVYEEYTPVKILQFFAKHRFINLLYKEYFKSLGIYCIDIPKDRYIAEVLKHKKENIFIVRLKYLYNIDHFQENIIFNGKECLIILPKTPTSTLRSFEDKISLRRFLEFVRVFTNFSGATDMLYDFLNQKISAEDIKMCLYVWVNRKFFLFLKVF